MTRQTLVSIGVLAAAAAAVVCSAGPAAAQGDYVVPRTEYGHPDLQGFWTNQTYTPLERPRDVDKAFYTEEEAAAIWQGRAGRESSLTTPGTIPDVHYDFTQFGLDRSQSTMTSNLRTSLIVDPPTGRLPERTAEGVRRAAERRAAREARGGQYDRAENLPLGARCIITGSAGPPMLNAGYNANFHIVQNRDHVMILLEQLHNARIIPLDDRPQAPEATRQWMGVPRGRWEGDTLVVETTNINGKNPFRGSSDRMRVVERFTRVADDDILYTFMVEDPATWVRPWTAHMPMKRSRGPLFEHACHEGNYGLFNILAGARAEEARAAAEQQQQQQD